MMQSSLYDGYTYAKIASIYFIVGTQVLYIGTSQCIHTKTVIVQQQSV